LIEALADVMLFRGIPEIIRSNDGTEFMEKELRQWPTKPGLGDTVHRAGKSPGER
jgi:hypothetical protein